MPAAPGPANAATLLRLMWLASPALPVGGFSYSEGLEAAIDAGLVNDRDTARDWLLDQLHLGLARSELAVLGQAIDAWRRGDHDRVRALNDWMLATRETAEARLQTEQMGRSMSAWLAQWPGVGAEALAALRALAPAPTWPLAFALAAAATPATPREAALAYGFSWAEAMVQAALKAVPLGQSAGQAVLAALAEALPAAVDAALALDDDARIAALPGLAILGARHETQYSRLFRS